MTQSDGAPTFDGALCRAARALLGLSQQEVCTLAGCSRKLLNDFENGLIEPKATKSAAIRNGLAEAGAVFVRIDDMLAVGVRPGLSGRRSARGRVLSKEGGSIDEMAELGSETMNS